MIREQTTAGCGLSLSRLCELAGVDRSRFYRPTAQRDDDVALRDKIQSIAVRCPAYGYRRITHELRRRGLVVNSKRVLGLMRRDNLLCLRRRGFVVTTDSHHSLPVHPNLARGLVLQGSDQLWVADLTYIRLGSEFVFLAVVLDAFSRLCVGWALSREANSELVTQALHMALRRRGKGLRPGMIHHSDRGCQYASRAYCALLAEHQICPSMSRPGNPYDNAKAESFIKTLKYEQVHINEYRDLEDARAQIGDFIARVYNKQRLHSALGYRPPHEFEQLHKNGVLTGTCQ